MSIIKSKKIGNKFVALVFSSRPCGGWKWAKTRGVYRVVAVDIEGAKKYKGDVEYIARNPLRYPNVADIKLTTWEVTTDYPGGKYGYREEFKNAKKYYNDIVEKED